MPKSNNSTSNFLNFTQLSDEKARELWSELKDIIVQAEYDRKADVESAERAMSIFKNRFWTKEDEEWFKEFNVSPYQIPAARAPLNQLVNVQRQSRYSWTILPSDEQSYERYSKNREKYVEENYDQFDTVQQAREYFDRFYDDEYAQAVTVRYNSIRTKNKTKWIESECFENALITGLDFLKTIFTTKDEPEGRIQTERRSVRRMLWDHSSVDAMLSDIEYIGEISRFFKQDLVQLFPEYKEEIEKHYDEYTNFRGSFTSRNENKAWETFYDFDNENDQARLKVAELWYQKPEERYIVLDKESGKPRLTKDGLSEEEIMDMLKNIVLDDLLDEVERGERSEEFFQRDESDVKEDVDSIVQDRYELRTTQVKTWYKTVLTYNGILEHKRDPLPHGGHPYTPAFAQFTEGWYTGIVHDIEDLLLAYNKAFMFREILMANSAKGTLFVDRNSMSKSGYDLDSLKEIYTEIGGIIDLDLKGGRRLGDVIQQINTVGQGITEITQILNEIEQRIYRIIGVNDAMMGMAGNEAAASQVRQQIQQGQGNNGLIFDNFARTLETHAGEKAIPMVVAELWDKQPQAIRDLSGSRSQWIELGYDKEFELFKDAIFSGKFETKLRTKNTDTQVDQQQQAMVLEMAQARPDEFSAEAALEYTDIPWIHDYLRRNKEIMRRKRRDQQMSQLDLQEMQKIMAQAGVDEDTANDIIKEGRKKAVEQYENRESNQAGQGAETVKNLSKEAKRQGKIEQTALEGGSEG